jgi:hypothetical protein
VRDIRHRSSTLSLPRIQILTTYVASSCGYRVTVKKETRPSKLQKKEKRKLDIGALSAVAGFRERRIPSYAAAIVFDRHQRLALRCGRIPVPYYCPTTERNPTPASTHILVPIVQPQEAESVSKLGTLEGRAKTSKSHIE